MINDELKTVLDQHFPQAEVTIGSQYVEMTVKPEDLHQTGEQLKQIENLSFDYLICLTGIDYADNMGVVYHLESVKHRHVMVLKVRTTDRLNPTLDTLSDVWIGAKYHEREVYDLLGVHFSNHTDLRRLFLDDEWGFPLRKDYVDEIRIVER